MRVMNVHVKQIMSVKQKAKKWMILIKCKNGVHCEKFHEEHIILIFCDNGRFDDGYNACIDEILGGGE